MYVVQKLDYNYQKLFLLHKAFHSKFVSSAKEEVQNISSQGTIAISKWTTKLNNIVLANNGHKDYFSNLKHAAFTASKKILFVNRGVDVSRPLSAQNDCFWWGYQNFSKINT